VFVLRPLFQLLLIALVEIITALKRGEADVTYAVYGALAEESRRDSKLKLEPVLGMGTQWVTFVEQNDPKSPWAGWLLAACRSSNALRWRCSSAVSYRSPVFSIRVSASCTAASPSSSWPRISSKVIWRCLSA
jgi:hypothetical protein